jgi:hypothetical protein
MALYRRSTVAAEGYSAGILEGDSTAAPHTVDADESSMASTDDTALHTIQGEEEDDIDDSWEDSSMPRTVELTASSSSVRRGAYSHVRTEESTAAAAPVGLSATSSDALHACLHPSCDHQRTSVSQHYSVFLPGGDGSLYLIVAVVAATVVAKLASSTSI